MSIKSRDGILCRLFHYTTPLFRPYYKNYENRENYQTPLSPDNSN